jgi:RimJ/RimL family protein N-acetyltransferase
VGLCGLVLDEDARTAIVWYLLRPDHQGRGLATRAVRTLASLAFGELSLHELRASCLAHNAASARVLARAGFRLAASGADGATYVLDHATWAAAAPVH